jgi:hypothetical protein
LILQIVLTENRKLKTENGIRGQETRVSGLTIREISAKIIARTKSKFGLRGLWEKFLGLTDQHCQNTPNKLK